MYSLKLLCLLLFFSSTTAQAMDFNSYVGFGSTRFTGNGNWAREYGFEGGVLYMRPLKTNWWLRTGLGLAQKNSDVDLPGNLTESVDYVFLEIPFTALYELTKSFQLFGGMSFDYVIDDDDIVGAKSIVFNLPIGFRINLPEGHGIEAYYEWGLTDLASENGAHFRIGNSIGFRYLHSFTIKL